jgi:acyl-CoA synthetase (NDP forming)
MADVLQPVAGRRAPVTTRRIHEFFNPTGIALIGATDKSDWSATTFRNLMTTGFAGEVYLVNPRGGTVHGHDALASIEELPDTVDLAYVMVSAPNVLGVLRELAFRDIRNAVILTAGFGETGESGRQLEQEVRNFAEANGMVILGPNGNGFVNMNGAINPFGLMVPEGLRAGRIGVVLQSGGLASAVLRLMDSRATGVSLLVSMGNEMMVSLTDVVRYLVEDPGTSVIAMFIESIRDPSDFLEVARAALDAGKPLVAIKAGSSQVSARVAMAHTGSLVGDDAVVDAVLRDNGVIRVRCLEDLVTTADLLARCGPLGGTRAAVVTASGGACEIIADRAEDEGIELPDFSVETEQSLREVLPDFAAVHNPLDVTGYVMVRPDLLTSAVRAVQTDVRTDFMLLLYDLPRTAPPESYEASWLAEYRRLGDILAASTKPVIVLTEAFTEISPYGRQVADRSGFPMVFGGIEHTLTALGHAVRWYEHTQRNSAERQEWRNPRLRRTRFAGQWRRSVV